MKKITDLISFLIGTALLFFGSLGVSVILLGSIYLGGPAHFSALLADGNAELPVCLLTSLGGILLMIRPLAKA